MNKRENYLMAFAEHKKPEHFVVSSDVFFAGGPAETWENGPINGGLDGYGVLWSVCDAAMGAGVPAAGHIVLDDICKWEDVVKFPDVDAIDWKKYAEEQLAGYNREERVLDYSCCTGQFLRTTSLMGFENALCSMITDEDAYSSLLRAITDNRIKQLERIGDYIHPDIVTLFVDVATERGLFMSHEMYKRIISPEHKRFADAVKGIGAYASIHCCGKCDMLVEDFINEGYTNWNSAQPSNDIKGVLQKYGDRISVSGGFDSNGKPGTAEATDEEVEAEVKRCIDEYGSEGSFIFFPVRMIKDVPREVVYAKIDEAVKKYAW